MLNPQETVDIVLELMMDNVKMTFSTMRDLMTTYESLEEEVERITDIIEKFRKVVDETETILINEMDKDEDERNVSVQDVLAGTIARYEHYIEINQKDITKLLAQQAVLRMGIDNYINHAESLMAPKEEVEEAEADAEADEEEAFMEDFIDSLLGDDDYEIGDYNKSNDEDLELENSLGCMADFDACDSVDEGSVENAEEKPASVNPVVDAINSVAAGVVGAIKSVDFDKMHHYR